MNILLAGGAGSFTNQIIGKLKKEGHRVHLLTGSRYRDDVYRKVFERYDLPYDSDCLSDVFESVNPDVTIFMGAFDSNFRWMNEQQELVHYTSGLMNLLTAYTMAGKGRFIYLSSDEVYSGDYESDVPEQATVDPADLKGMALAQGEDICENFKKNRDADVVILRLDHLYMIPKDPKEVNDICSRMCLEAMQTGSIVMNRQHSFSLLYESDAIQFIYNVLRSDECGHYLYNLSSSEEVTEEEIAKYIEKAMRGEKEITLIENEPSKRRCILSNQRYDQEFGIKIFANTRETIEKIVQYMLKHKNLFLTGEQEEEGFFKRLMNRAGWLIMALIPYLENLICFIPFFMLNNRAVGSQYFSNLDFYLLYVLLFAIVYGQRQATFSAILAVAGYLFRQMYTRSGFELMLDYNTYVWIAQLFILGLVVGYMKDQIQKMRLESEEERRFLNRQLSDIKDINGSNVRVKDALETQIVNQSDSIGKIYQITSTLEQYTPEEVLFYAPELLKELFGSEDIAIYTISGDTYARLFSSTSDRAKALGKSLRYRELGEVYNTLMERKVYINRSMDEKYPMMANAIFDDDDQMQSLLMIWRMPWERMTLGQANLLTVITALIQSAVLRASRYITMLENRRYQEGAFVMETEAFTSLVRVFLAARDRHLTDCVVLEVQVPEDQYEEVGSVLTKAVRVTDYIGRLEDGRLCILLTNATNEDAAFVIRRIQNEKFGCVLLEDFRI